MAATVSISRRYARALIDIASEQKQIDQVGEQLAAFVKLFSDNRELGDVMVNPAYNSVQRLAVVESLVSALQLSPTVANLLRLLVERNRTPILPDIQRLYADLADARSGRVRGEVVTAVPLPGELLKRIEQSLEKLTQRNVVLEAKVDPAVIGGVTARVGSMLVDGSVRNQLEQIRRELRGA